MLTNASYAWRCHFEAEILRITTLLGNASLLDQSGLEHGRPLTTGGLFSNGGAADMNGWASAFQPEVWILTINMTPLCISFYNL